MKADKGTSFVFGKLEFYVHSILQANQIELDSQQWMQLQKWVTMLLEVNQQINLISRKDTEKIWENHVLHSLALLVVFKIPENAKVCDIGTGGGFPGLALAIACPHAHFTLIDGTEKKIGAVQNFIAELALTNTVAVTGRAEKLAERSFYQRRFSIFTARAVAPLNSLEVWTRGLRAPHEVLHAYKGGDLRNELNTLCKNKRIRKVLQFPLLLKGACQFSRNQKQIVSLYF